MEMKVNVPRWTVQARQAAGAELLSAASAGASSAGGVSVEERAGPCDPSKALAATVFGAVLLMALCERLDCAPDIWALRGWGGWLTPAPPRHGARRRFDTAFLLCCLRHAPPVEPDRTEVVGYKVGAARPGPQGRHARRGSALARGDARRDSVLARGDARRDSAVTCGDARGDSVLARGDARGDSVLARGDARGDSVLARGDARGDSVLARGDARRDSAVTRGDARGDSVLARGDARGDSVLARGDARGDSAVTRGDARRDSVLAQATECFLSQEIWLAPPQFYEMRRLETFDSLSALHRFSSDYPLEITEKWLPIKLLTADGTIMLLPGDELYRKDSHFLENPMSTDRKTEEILKEGRVVNRVVIHSSHLYEIHVSLLSEGKHVYPKSYVATLLETWLARSHSILGGSGGQDESEPVQVALEERDRASLLTLQFTAPPQGGAVRSQAVTRAVGAQVRSSRLEACAQAQGERGPLKVRVPQAGPRPGWSIRLLSCSGSLLPAGVVRAGERDCGIMARRDSGSSPVLTPLSCVGSVTFVEATYLAAPMGSLRHASHPALLTPSPVCSSGFSQKPNEKPLRLTEKKDCDEKNGCVKLLQFLNPDPLRADEISDLQQLQKVKSSTLQPGVVLRNRIEPCLTMEKSPLSADLKKMFAILDNFKKNVEVEERESAPHQIVAVGVHWNRHVDHLVREFMKDPYIVITALEEAALYGNVQQVVESNSIFCLKMHKEMAFNLKSILEQWKKKLSSGSHIVLTLTDDCIPLLAITDATRVVHFSFPSSPKVLGGRLYCMSDHFQSLTEQGSPAEQGDKKTKSVLLLTERNASHAVGVLRYLERADAKIPSELYEFTAGVLEAKEDKKARRPLCPYLKAFGFCKTACPALCCVPASPASSWPCCLEGNKGHKRGRRDKKRVVGRLIIPFYVSNATNYFGRILDKHLDLYATLNAEMNEYFKDPSNKTAAEKVESFGLYGLEEKTLFQRVQVLEVSQKEDTWGLGSVLVKFIDEGRTKLIARDQLLLLPEKFHTLPPQAVEFIVCRVKPADSEIEWNPKVTRYIHHKIVGKIHDAKVVLALGNTLWIDPMVHVTKLSNLKTSVIDYNVRAEILSMGMGVDNSEHIEQLKKLYKEAKLPAFEELLGQTSTPATVEDAMCLQGIGQEDGGTEGRAASKVDSDNQKPGCFHPQIKWFQKDDVVILKIKLRSVKDYKCKFFTNRVIFSAWVGDKFYMADLELQGDIRKDDCKCVIKDEEPLITLAKEKRACWCGLLTKRNPNVAFDFDHWEEHEEDSPFSKVVYSKNLSCKVPALAENSSTSSDTTDGSESE
ncbi:tudor domain containing 12 [Cricetulus griseus]